MFGGTICKISLNSKTPIFIHSAYHTTSAIDMAMASPAIALDFQWSFHDDLCGNDHFPIFLSSFAESNTGLINLYII